MFLSFILPSLAQAQTLNVFAASSLLESFTQLAEAFEARHEGVDVRLNVAGSAVLAAQIGQGAPADVFASADLDTLLRVVDAEQVRAFAANEIVLITAKASAVQALPDLTQPHLLVLAGENVPIGNYAREVLGRLESLYGAGYADTVLANLVSEETNVRQAAAKVELGEADATFVYATDAPQLENVNIINLPDEVAVRADYYVATVDTAQLELAEVFLAFLGAEEGRRILKGYGFGAASD